MSKTNATPANRSGFTIVELLVVIVVVGVLATVSIITLDGIQERARITAATQRLNNVAKVVALHVVAQGSLPDEPINSPGAAAWRNLLSEAGVLEGVLLGEESYLVCYAINAANLAEQSRDRSYSIIRYQSPGVVAGQEYLWTSQGGAVARFTFNPSFGIGNNWQRLCQHTYSNNWIGEHPGAGYSFINSVYLQE